MLLYAAETWPITGQRENKLASCDYRMLRYMAHVRWEDRVSNDELARKCGVEDVRNVLRRQRLRWYCHIQRREEEHILKKACQVVVEGRKSVGRPKKTWRRCVEEDMKKMKITEECIQNRREWRRLIARPTPEGNRRTLNEE